MSVPTAAGTRRVAGVSRRRPRSGPVRDRVGGWFDVITPPSSHMCGGREAAPRGGGGAVVGAGVGRPRCGTDWRGGEGPSECVYAHAYRRCAEALLRRTVVEHAEPVCPGLQTLPLRAAFAPTGAFGSACFVVSGRRWRGAPGDGAGYGMSLPSSPATRTVPATGFRPPAGVQARPVKPRPPLCAAHLRPVKPRPPLCAAHPRPVKPRPPPYPRNGHFSSVSGRQGWSEFHRTRRPTPQGWSEFHPAARLPHATVNMTQAAASHARLPHDRAQRGSSRTAGKARTGGSGFAAVGWTGHNSDARRSQLAPVTPIRGS